MRLVLFDVDGTLVDSRNIIVAAQRAAFAAHGIAPPSRERSLSIVGLSLVQAFTVLVGPDGPVESLAEAYRQAFAALRADPAHAEPVFPGADSCLRRLAARDDVLLGIATGKSQRGVRHILAREGWTGLFATIQTADDAPSKPDPGMVLQAMAELGVGSADTAIVGDSSFDMEMGRAAGIWPIGVAWGFQPVAVLRETGAAQIVDSFPALDAALDRFLEPSPSWCGVPISPA